MASVTMPDGTVVDMPDQLDAATGARLRAFQQSQITGVPGNIGSAKAAANGQPAYQPDTTDVANRLAGGQELPGFSDILDMVRNAPAHVLPQVRALLHSFGNELNTDIGTHIPQNAEAAANVITHPAQTASNVGTGLRNATAGNEGANLLAGAAFGPALGAARAGVGAVADAVTAARTPLAAGDIEGALSAAGYKNTKSGGIVSNTAQSIAGEPQVAATQTHNNQAVTNALAHHDSGVPPEQELNPTNYDAARTAGPGKVYDAVRTSLPEQLTQTPQLQADIRGVGDTVSQLPKSPDVDLLKQTMLDQPNMSRDQLFANIQQARQRASRFYAAEGVPDSQAMGDAYSGIANAYENFLGEQIKANPNSPVTLADFQKARTQFAQSYGLEAATQGVNINASKLAQYYKGTDPATLSGGTRLIIEQAQRFPPSTGFGPTTLEPNSGGNVVRSAAGPAIGAATGAMFGGAPGAAIGSGIGAGAQSAMTAALRRILGGSEARGASMGAAAPHNPQLGNIFGTDLPAFEGLTPPPGTAYEPHQPELAAGSPRPRPTRTARELQGMASAPAQQPLALGGEANPVPENNSDLGAVMSQGVPEGIVQRSKPGGLTMPVAHAPAFPTGNTGISAEPIRLGNVIPKQRGAVGPPVDISELRKLMNNPQTYDNGPIEIPKGAAKKPGAANDQKFGPFKGNPQTIEDFLRENLGNLFR